jgi:ribosome-associated protein
LEVARNMVNVLEDKKGENILLLDIQGLASFADFFIICNGTSDRMLDSLAKAVTENAHQQYELVTKVEGRPEDGWLLVDLGDVVVHLFSPEQREYYRLEQLWDKAKVLLRLQ